MDEVLEGEEPIEPTDIYVTLYTDGTLGFSNNSEPISGKEVSKTYNNIKGQDFEINWDEYTVNTPWYGDVASVKTVEISNKIAPTDMDGWFFACTELTEIKNIQNLRTDNVTSMIGLFESCIKLISLDLSNFNTSKVTSMEDMFYDCRTLTSLDVSSFDTSNVTDMRYMFGSDESMALTEIIFSDKFDTSNVNYMNAMFCGCTELQSLDLSGFDTSKVTKMKAMFFKCASLSTLDLKSFDTSKVTNMQSMFAGCTSMQEIKVSNKWVINEGTNNINMFFNCGVDSVTVEQYFVMIKIC